MAAPSNDNAVVTASTSSPLRYPGGKARAVKHILPILQSYGLREIASPFMGGGSIEIAAAAAGIRVHASELFDPLVCFWHYALNEPVALADEVKKFQDMNKVWFKALQKQLPTMPDNITKAAVYFVLNRSAFSGNTTRGGMMPKLDRFTETSIEALSRFCAPNLTVEKMDCVDAINKHTDKFLYLDPPYDLGKKSTLYDKHEEFDHNALFDVLKDRPNWIMSYGSDAATANRYAGFYFQKPVWAYGMSENKASNEVLIFSNDLAANDNAAVVFDRFSGAA